MRADTRPRGLVLPGGSSAVMSRALNNRVAGKESTAEAMDNRIIVSDACRLHLACLTIAVLSLDTIDARGPGGRAGGA